MERSTRATVTSSDRPAPSDSTTARVSPPGAPRLPMARASSGRRERGRRRASPGQSRSKPPEQGEHARHAEAVVEGEQPGFGGEDGKAHEQGSGSSREEDDAGSRQDALGCHLVAKQHAGPHLLGAAERPQREQQRHQEAVGGGGEQAARGQAELRLDRQGIAERGAQAPAGSAAPAPMPITTPMPAISSTCSRCTPKMTLAVAPRLLKVAMTLRRRSM